MLVTIKTLKQETFKIEIDPESSILELKKKIEGRNGSEYSASCQKLIYSGKFLEDGEKVSFYEIKEDRFIVVMVQAQKPPAQPAIQPVEKAETPIESEEMDVSEPYQTDAQTSAPVVEAENSLATGDQFETVVKELMSMGFPRDKVLKAMTTGCNNADRAAEYLLSGSIPDVEEEAQVSMQDGLERAQGLLSNGNPLSFLRSNPQFQQAIRLVQSNPAILPSLFEQISRTNPDLMNLIQDNKESFLQIISQPIDSDNQSDATTGSPSQQNGEGQNYIRITQEEREAIDRLMALGFPEALCVQAYFACDKNEQLAANFLFSQHDDY